MTEPEDNASTPRKKRKSGYKTDNINSFLPPVEIGGKKYYFTYGGGCWVCQSGKDVVTMVNTLLLDGVSYAEVARKIAPLINKPITYIHIGNHYRKHVPSQIAAAREIMERRATDLQQNFIEGTTNLVSPYVFAEQVMKKAFENAVKNGASVTIKDGMEAAKLLDKIIEKEEGQSDMANAMNQLNSIITAVRAVVPPEMFDEIIQQIKGGNSYPVRAAIEEAEIVEDDEFDPSFAEKDED